ncbi:MAG TPA: hypothetical protein VML75_03575 [Kofleriaceae bacterium]|nr:hypothetical protein [Kofleriaceae bacterium]
MARLFISQNTLDEWNADNRATVVGDRLTLDGRSLEIHPAVYFEGVAGNDSDPHDLVGTVRYEHELDGMGAELYMNSVIYGDNAYDVVCGFMGTLVSGA